MKIENAILEHLATIFDMPEAEKAMYVFIATYLLGYASLFVLYLLVFIFPMDSLIESKR